MSIIVIFLNDAKTYTLKRERSKLYKVLTRKTSQLLNKINDMVSNIDTSKWTNNIRFDTDSAPVEIDDRCAGCISHVPKIL